MFLNAPLSIMCFLCIEIKHVWPENKGMVDHFYAGGNSTQPDSNHYIKGLIFKYSVKGTEL